MSMLQIIPANEKLVFSEINLQLKRREINEMEVNATDYITTENAGKNGALYQSHVPKPQKQNLRGLRGNERAAQEVEKYGKEYGVFFLHWTLRVLRRRTLGLHGIPDKGCKLKKSTANRGDLKHIVITKPRLGRLEKKQTVGGNVVQEQRQGVRADKKIYCCTNQLLRNQE